MNPVEVVFSFDTTGSMYGCLAQVRESVKDTVSKLFSHVPNLKIGIIAHGDYCDERTSYVTSILDLTSSESSICKFVQNVGRTHGGDAPECYELVLRQSRTEINWTAGATKIVVVIGDNLPHPKNDPQNVDHIDWKNELKLMIESGIKVYGVHALGDGHVASFYQDISSITGGMYLELDQFEMIEDMILAVCYKQLGGKAVEEFEQEVVSSGRMNRSRDTMFSTLLKRTTKRYKKPKLIPVNPGRFQVFTVRRDSVIKNFVENRGLEFVKGKGFYELSTKKKKTKIQDYKEVIIKENDTGDMFTGAQVRKLLGLPDDGSVDLGKRDVERLTENYTIFVQSTSLNRKLPKGTQFMYDISGL